MLVYFQSFIFTTAIPDPIINNPPKIVFISITSPKTIDPKTIAITVSRYVRTIAFWEETFPNPLKKKINPNPKAVTPKKAIFIIS